MVVKFGDFKKINVNNFVKFVKENNIKEGEKEKIDNIIFYLEPWKLICFENEKINNSDSYELYNLAIRKSKKRLNEENWDGFIYLYPDEINIAEYGGSLFFKID